MAVPVFGAGGEVLAAIELTVPDLGRELQPVMAALSIAARSLSRELAGGCARISEGAAADTVGGVYATVSDVETRVAQHAG